MLTVSLKITSSVAVTVVCVLFVWVLALGRSNGQRIAAYVQQHQQRLLSKLTLMFQGMGETLQDLKWVNNG